MSRNKTIQTRNFIASEELEIKTKLLHNLNNYNINKDDRIYVESTENFKNTGILYIGTEIIKYNNKALDYFYNIKRGYNASIIQNHMKGTLIKQLINYSTSDNPGWYIPKNDNYSITQPTLKINNADIISPGVIRFIKNDIDPSQSKFQGCIEADNDNIKWVDFNALKGDKGEKGNDINTYLKFINISDLDNLNKSNNLNIIKENEGEIIKCMNPENNEVYNRNLISGYKNKDNKIIKTIDIKTADNSIILNSLPQEYKHDLTFNLNDIKDDMTFKSYGETVIIYAANDIKKGQIVELVNINMDNKTYLAVQSIDISSQNLMYLSKYTKANKYGKVTNLIFGLSCEDGKKGDKIEILKKGIGLLKIGNNVVDYNSNIIIKLNSDYIGENIYMDTKGYGFMTDNIQNLPDPYISLGGILEIGDKTCRTGNYVLINLDIKKNEL